MSMEITDFWRLIEAAKVKSRGVCEAQAETLRALLADLPAEEIAEFNRIFIELHQRAYQGNLWEAGSIINSDQGSSDGFIYFRSWLIGQGQAMYERALEDPETLAEVGVAPREADCEELMYAAWFAYDDKTGDVPTEMYESVSVTGEPIGGYWEDRDLKRHFPRLCAMYEWEPIEDAAWET